MSVSTFDVYEVESINVDGRYRESYGFFESRERAKKYIDELLPGTYGREATIISRQGVNIDSRQYLIS